MFLDVGEGRGGAAAGPELLGERERGRTVARDPLLQNEVPQPIVAAVDGGEVRVADVGELSADREQRRQPIEGEYGGAERHGGGGERRPLARAVVGEFAEPGDEEFASPVGAGEHLHQHPFARRVESGLPPDLAQDRAERAVRARRAVALALRNVPIQILLRQRHLDLRVADPNVVHLSPSPVLSVIIILAPVKKGNRKTEGEGEGGAPRSGICRSGVAKQGKVW